MGRYIVQIVILIIVVSLLCYGVLWYLPLSCRNGGVTVGFRDSYFLILILKDKDGRQYREKYENISLSDWETIYGNNSDEIVEVKMWLI